MSLVAYVPLLVGVLYLPLSVAFLSRRSSIWEPRYGGLLILVGLANLLISAVGLVSTSSFIDSALRSRVLTFASYLIPLSLATYAALYFLFIGIYLGIISEKGKKWVALLVGPILVAMPLGTTWTVMDGELAEPVPLLAQLPEPVLKTSAYFVAPLHFGFGLAAAGMLLWGVYQYREPTLRLGILLLIGGPVWYFSSYIAAPVFGLQSDPFLAVTAVSGAVGLPAVERVYRAGALADQRPLADTIGRNRVIEELSLPVLVVDRTGTISDANLEALEVFSLTKTDLTSVTLDDLFPNEAVESIEACSEDFEISLGDAQRFIVSVSELTSGRGRFMGRTLVFRNVTEAERRRQQIQVLNRVLRHNLRNEATIILGHTNHLQNQESYDPDSVTQISARVGRLVEIGNRAQEVETVMSRTMDSTSSRAFASIVDDAVEYIEAEYAADIETDISAPVVVETDGVILELIVSEALRNAVVHADDDAPRVTLRESPTEPGEPLSFSVIDDGPGIPDEEIAVIREEKEVPLRHGSGLGLWLLHWGIQRLGGSVSFDTQNGDGTEVTFTVPGKHVYRGE